MQQTQFFLTNSVRMANLNSNAFERLDKKNAVLLIVDHQVGLFQLVRDQSPEEYRANVLAHAALGKAFDLPTILTSSAENGECRHLDTIRGKLMLIIRTEWPLTERDP